MDANRGLIPHPERGICHIVAGSNSPVERPVAILNHSCRPDAPTPAFSTMLALLETLRNLIVSGHEPASYLIAPREGGSLWMSSGQWPRAGDQWVFRVGSRAVSDGRWLEVADETGRTGYRLEQFCRTLPGGGLEALPHVWSATERPRPAWTPGDGLSYRRAFSTACPALTR